MAPVRAHQQRSELAATNAGQATGDEPARIVFGGLPALMSTAAVRLVDAALARQRQTANGIDGLSLKAQVAR